MIRDFPRALKILERTLEASLPECAREFGVSRERIRHLSVCTAYQLLQRLQDEKKPRHNWASVTARRRHVDFWRRQIRKYSEGS